MPACVSPFFNATTMSVPMNVPATLPASAKRIRAPDHNRSDAVEVCDLVAAWIGDRRAAKRLPSGEGVEDASDCVDAENDTGDIDAV